MGWSVIGFGNIDVDEENVKDIIGLMTGDKKEVIDKLTGNKTDEFENVEANNGNITFRMWGNKGINYSRLDAIKEYCKANKIDIEINVNEFVEGDSGYYYNSGEGNG